MLLSKIQTLSEVIPYDYKIVALNPFVVFFCAAWVWVRCFLLAGGYRNFAFIKWSKDVRFTHCLLLAHMSH